MKNEILTSEKTYFIGRPEVSLAGRFGKRVTTYNVAIINIDGSIIYKRQSYTTLGKMNIPTNVELITKSEFNKLIK